MRCDFCKGTRLVKQVKDARGEDAIVPTLEEPELPDVMPCPYCEASGRKHHDHDQQNIGVCLPPDDDGTIGDRIDVYCERSHAVGSDRPPNGSIEIVTTVNKFSLIGLSPENFRAIGEFLSDYADRMTRW